jgi:DNA polymerase alpha subunit A
MKGKSFTHVIGTSWSLLENFIIKKNIKGPQWLKIKNAEKINPSNRKSWCVFEC